MTGPNSQQEQAAEAATRAAQASAAGDTETALTRWRQAMLLYAEAYRVAESEEAVPALLTRARADACRHYGNALMQQEQYPQAANVYQEAADLYGLLSGASDVQNARECARKALAAVAALRANPRNQIYLLIARYDRQQQQLALQPGTFAQQADCILHIAQIFLRRERPLEAYTRFGEALELYKQAEPTEAAQLGQAECHHRLGHLLATVLIDEPNAARQALAHYDAAIALYLVCEPAEQENYILCAHAHADLQRRLKE